MSGLGVLSGIPPLLFMINADLSSMPRWAPLLMAVLGGVLSGVVGVQHRACSTLFSVHGSLRVRWPMLPGCACANYFFVKYHIDQMGVGHL